MGTESDKKPLLTLNDPVDASTVKRIGELLARRHQLGDMLLDYEQEKVKILVESRRIDDERERLFNQILTSRGLAASVPVEIDPETGRISLRQPLSQPPIQTPAAPPAPSPVVEPQQQA